ncbi:PE family protein [Mycobacterium kansasii]|nr:PE family protein [Mycobacterium kansasii]
MLNRKVTAAAGLGGRLAGVGPFQGGMRVTLPAVPERLAAASAQVAALTARLAAAHVSVLSLIAATAPSRADVVSIQTAAHYGAGKNASAAVTVERVGESAGCATFGHSWG